MECPHCAATLPDDDVFCEECGVRLAEAAPAACRCGAGADEIDEDGFCGQCGIRLRSKPEDHIEIVISPDFAAVADRGIRHERNEDRVAIRGTAQGSILVVCDGVSSSNESQTAAAAAVEAIADALEHGEGVEAAFRLAAHDVAQLDGSSDAPSTTAIAAVVRDPNAVIGWVGDSRAYWIDAGGARQLTSDHSWLNDVTKSGEMTMEEASADPKAHAITRWLGGDSGENAKPDILEFPMPGQGVLLLCTDGLWNYAPAPEEIANLVNGADGDAVAVCRRLVEFANKRGGQDNVTAAILRVGDGTAGEKHGERIQG